MPIDTAPSSNDEPKDQAAPRGMTLSARSAPAAAPSSALVTPKIPTDEEIAGLGSRGHDAYAKITEKVLSQTKASDLGEMSAKLTELVSVSKGFNPNAAKHGFLEKAIGILHSQREQILAHAQTVQRRINTMVGELDRIADRQRDRIKDMAALQQENQEYLQGLKADTAQAKGWLTEVEAARAAPADPSDPVAAAKVSALQRASQRLQVAINNIGNAMTLARQQALEIQMTKDNSSAILEEFTKTKLLVIPSLQSILAQYLVSLEQKKAVAADNMLRDTLAEAMKETARMTGDNAVQITALQQKPMISVQTIEECQTLLEGTASKIREIEEAGRQQRAQDAAKRAELEQRMLSAVRN